jgi:hypothetical protein
MEYREWMTAGKGTPPQSAARIEKKRVTRQVLEFNHD